MSKPLNEADRVVARGIVQIDFQDPKVDRVERVAAALDRARTEERERVRALLKRIEWRGSAYPDASDLPCCPACDSEHGHEPDCELAALLASP